MKRRSKILLACGIGLIMMITGSIGTLAYFTDYEDAEGGAVIQLEGETELHETPEDDKKTIWIENTGDCDVIVRVAIYGSFLGKVEADEKDWVKDGEYWYYKHILEPGQSTSEIVAHVDVEAAKEAEHDFEIIVVHESERVSYDGTPENKVVKPEGWKYPDIAKGMSEEVEG